MKKLFVPFAALLVGMTVSAFAADCDKCPVAGKAGAKPACCDAAKAGTTAKSGGCTKGDAHKAATTAKKGLDLSEKGGKALTSL